MSKGQTSETFPYIDDLGPYRWTTVLGVKVKQYNTRFVSKEKIQEHAQKLRRQQATQTSIGTSEIVKSVDNSSNLKTDNIINNGLKDANKAVQKAGSVLQSGMGGLKSQAETLTSGKLGSNIGAGALGGEQGKIVEGANKLNNLKSKAAGLKGLGNIGNLLGIMGGTALLSKMSGVLNKIPAGKIVGQIAVVGALGAAIAKISQKHTNATSGQAKEDEKDKAVDKDGNEVEEDDNDDTSPEPKEENSTNETTDTKLNGYLPSKEMTEIASSPFRMQQTQQALQYTEQANICRGKGQINKASIYDKMALEASILATTQKLNYTNETKSHAQKMISEYKQYQEDKENAFKEAFPSGNVYK